MGINVNFDMKVINKAYRPELFNYDKLVNVFYGGSGSGKSHFVVQKMILKSMKYSNRRTLVVRKVGASIRDSIFHLFTKVLSDWGLLSNCRVNKSNMEIELPNGSVFLFKGYDDPEKIKSISAIDDIVVEEATQFSGDDFDELVLRLRTTNPHLQIHLMFNPVRKANWVYPKWFEDGVVIDNDTVIVKTTYLDNSYQEPGYGKFLMSLKESNPNKYKVYALGEFATMDELVYGNVSVDNFDYVQLIQDDKSIKALFGLDFGFTADPTALVALLYDEANKKIYIYDEMYERGLLNNQIANEIIKRGYRKEKILADSATPKDIEELRRLGLDGIKGAKKGPGSIMNGVQFIQQHEVIVHESCVNAIQEFNNFTWVKDKNGEYINKTIDDNNHLMDALRYALTEVNGKGTKAKIMDLRLLGLR